MQGHRAHPGLDGGALPRGPRAVTARRLPAALLAAIGVALSLRLFMLGAWPLWIDETATAAFAGLSWSDLFGTMARLEPTPPTYYALVKLWTGMVGASDAALRWPSAILGAAALLPAYVFCRDAFGPAAAKWAAALLAVSVEHLAHSQEARVYSLFFLVFACGLLSAQRLAAAAGSPGPKRRRLASALCLCCAGMAWLHNTGAIAAAALFIYAAAVLGAERRLSPARAYPFLAAGFGAALLATPVLLLAAAIARDPANGLSWMEAPDFATALVVFSAALMVPLPSVIQGLPLLPPGLQAAAYGVGLAAAFAVLLGALRPCRTHPQAFGLLAALLFSFAAFLGVSQIVPVLLTRTILYTTALFLPLVAAGLGTAGHGGRLGGLCLSLVLLSSAAVAPAAYLSPKHNEDWNSVAARLAGEAGAGEPILVLGAFEAVTLERYLAPRGAPHTVLTFVPAAEAERLQGVAAAVMTGSPPLRSDLSPAGLCTRVGAARGLWLVWRRSPLQPAFRDAVADVLRGAGSAPLTAEADRRKIWVERWTAPGCAGEAAR